MKKVAQRSESENKLFQNLLQKITNTKNNIENRLQKRCKQKLERLGKELLDQNDMQKYDKKFGKLDLKQKEEDEKVRKRNTEMFVVVAKKRKGPKQIQSDKKVQTSQTKNTAQRFSHLSNPVIELENDEVFDQGGKFVRKFAHSRSTSAKFDNFWTTKT